MTVEFVRFVVPTWIHRESQAPIGVIGAAYELLRQDTLSHQLRSELERSIKWFEEKLPVPDRFNRTKSKGWYRRETRGIGWLRTTASEHIAAMPISLPASQGAGTRQSRFVRNAWGTWCTRTKCRLSPSHFATRRRSDHRAQQTILDLDVIE